MVEVKFEEAIDNKLGTICAGSPDDVFITCASYEPRTLSASNCLSDNYKAKKGIVYYNKEFKKSSLKNINSLEAIIKKKCTDYTVVEGSLFNPWEQFLSLKKALITELKQDIKTVTLDSTTFNREALLVVVALLKTNYSNVRIRLLYVSPKRHGEWLSHGFFEVRSIIGFPGIQNSALPTLLVVLSGFEGDRVTKLIEEHEPKLVLLGLGNPPTDFPFLKRNEFEQKTILARQEVKRFNFPAHSIDECHDCLETVIKKNLSCYNIILAPMSTKLSTIAAFLTAELHKEIQLTYCVPGEYNITDYSQGSNSIFIEEI